MAIAFAVDLRNARLDAITTFAGSGSLIRIYSGSRPATGGTATTLLAELSWSSTMASAASSGVLTGSAVTSDSSADSTGTASWFRHVKSDGTTHVADGNCGTSGSDLNLTTLSIVATQPVSISSYVYTEGNP